MPNYVKNFLRITGKKEVVKCLLEAVAKGDNKFSFNKIVPMPDFVFKGALSSEDRKNNPNRNWYDWCCYFWGCKWNTNPDDVYVEINENDSDATSLAFIEFETPWNRPQPVITALAFMFPELDFVHKYADEGIGYNVGTDYYSGGSMIKMDTFTEGSEAAKRFACELWDRDYDEYIKDLEGEDDE